MKKLLVIAVLVLVAGAVFAQPASDMVDGHLWVEMRARDKMMYTLAVMDMIRIATYSAIDKGATDAEAVAMIPAWSAGQLTEALDEYFADYSQRRYFVSMTALIVMGVYDAWFPEDE